MLTEFNITVLGSARAGKTSLLSSIYNQFSQVIGEESDLEIKPVGEADAQLEKQVADLQSAFSSGTQMPLNNADVVPATTIVGEKSITKIDYDYNFARKNNKYRNGSSKNGLPDLKQLFNLGQKNKKPKVILGKNGSTDIGYRFNLGQKNKKPKVQLVLRDYPGEQILDNSKEVIYRIRECAVTMITIDTPALMVEGERSLSWAFHKDRNLLEKGKSSSSMQAIFQEAYKGLKEKKLVILVPVKCEKWMKDAASANQLLDRIKTGYKSLLDLFASEEMQDNVAVVVTPVETMGNVVYAYMDKSDSYSPQFMKRGIAAQFDPRYCDQPLRYILRFVLKRFLESPGFWFEWFGNDKPFLNAIDDFARGCKSDPSLGIQTNGFTVIQGGQLL
ncbi:hypothetical protein [Larkinella arboricola]